MSRRPRNWMATAQFTGDTPEQLICLAESIPRLEQLYEIAYEKVIPNHLRARIIKIKASIWRGLPEQGQWLHDHDLPIPS